jgi:hypothetical protein
VVLRHVAAATTLALVGALLLASPAQARPERDLTPRGPDHFPASISTTVPAGGTSMITTPTLGKDVKTLTVTVKPKNADATETATYDQFVNTIGTLSKGQRLLVCVMLYQSIVFPQDSMTEEFEVNGLFATIAGAILLSCLQMADVLQTNNRALSSAAGQKCGQARPSLPATVEKVDGGYSVKASGTATKATKPKLKIRCKQIGHTLRYTIRSAKKGQTLRKAVGKKISVGLKSPSDAPTSVPVQVTFATP